MFSSEPGGFLLRSASRIDRALLNVAELPRPLMSEALSDSGRDLKDDATVVRAAVFGRAIDIAGLVEH